MGQTVAGNQIQTMARSRALVTGTEFDRISGRADVEDDKKYQAVSRVRKRIRDELPREMAMLEEHHPELLAELRDVVCEEPHDVLGVAPDAPDSVVRAAAEALREDAAGERLDEINEAEERMLDV